MISKIKTPFSQENQVDSAQNRPERMIIWLRWLLLSSQEKRKKEKKRMQVLAQMQFLLSKICNRVFIENSPLSMFYMIFFQDVYQTSSSSSSSSSPLRSDCDRNSSSRYRCCRMSMVIFPHLFLHAGSRKTALFQNAKFLSTIQPDDPQSTYPITEMLEYIYEVYMFD